MTAVEVIDLTRHYRMGPVRALDGVNLAIEAGEFVAIVGRSGSGKTTLLDCMGLLLRPTSGRVLVDGLDASTIGERARADLRASRIGFIFQDFNLLSSLSAIENVMLPLRYSHDRGQGRERATALLAEVGLAERARSRPNQMSGGEQQRVALARAFMNRPHLVLGDEPTGEVDSETRTQLVALMRRMNQQHGVTFVIVTHDLELAEQANRVVRLTDGRVAFGDSVRSRYDRCRQ